MITTTKANKLLPQKPASVKVHALQLVYLLIAVPKWGKTTFFMKFPDSILLAFEQGHAFHSGHKVIIDCWDHHRGTRVQPYQDADGMSHMSMIQAVEVLQASDRFKFVIIDTADMAAKMATDFWTEKLGIKHVSELEWGRGYDQAQNDPFRINMLKILKTGRGLGFTTHSKVDISRFTAGEKAMKETSLPRGIAKFVVSQADIIGHGEFGKTRPGHRYRDRILALEGDADTLAGNRTGAVLPARYVVDPNKTWEQFSGFFKDPAAAEKAERMLLKALRRSAS